MRIKYLALAASILLLAACQTPADSTSGSSMDGRTNGGISHLSPADMKAAMQEYEQMKANVGDRVFFGYNRYDLSSEGRATLDKQIAWLKRYPGLVITVEGHADERGTREYNLALGERRASAIKNYMTAMGVGENNIMTISYGKERPAVTGSNEAAWAQNRRGVTVVNQ